MSEKKMIEIGKTGSGESVELDLYKFIQTRGMIQASSGGGKSWLARVIAEKTQRAQIPVWMIDPEGEYTTLREKFEVVIFGASEDADLPTDERTLSLVLPELFVRGVSVVFDLSENPLEEKQVVTALVCTFLLSIPKPEQKPILLIVDEAQVLAPEREATDSVVALSDVASRGRKRRLGLLVVTQRLSALNKNLTTQLQNRFVGFCIEDIEIARAAKLVNEHKKDNAAELPDFNPGDFFAVGGAVNFRRVVKFHSAPVETTHGDNLDADFGSTGKTPIASEGLAELIKVLREKLTAEPDESGGSDSRQLPDEIRKREQRLLDWEKSIEEREQELLKDYKIIQDFKPLVFQKMENVFAEARELVNQRLDGLKAEFERVLKVPDEELPPVKSSEKFAENMREEVPGMHEVKSELHEIKVQPVKQKSHPVKSLNSDLKAAEQKIINSLRTFEQLGLDAVHRANVAALAGYSHSSGSYGAHLTALKNNGFIEYAAGSRLRLTDKGRESSNPIADINSNDQLHETWFKLLSAAETSILRELINSYPRTISRETIGHKTGYSHTSGSFGAHLTHLKSLGLIEYGKNQTGDRGAHATKLLFPFEAKGGARS